MHSPVLGSQVKDLQRGGLRALVQIFQHVNGPSSTYDNLSALPQGLRSFLPSHVASISYLAVGESHEAVEVVAEVVVVGIVPEDISPHSKHSFSEVHMSLTAFARVTFTARLLAVLHVPESDKVNDLHSPQLRGHAARVQTLMGLNRRSWIQNSQRAI